MTLYTYLNVKRNKIHKRYQNVCQKLYSLLDVAILEL